LWLLFRHRGSYNFFGSSQISVVATDPNSAIRQLSPNQRFTTFGEPSKEGLFRDVCKGLLVDSELTP
jgi:hypothetical protein